MLSAIRAVVDTERMLPHRADSSPASQCRQRSLGKAPHSSHLPGLQFPTSRINSRTSQENSHHARHLPGLPLAVAPSQGPGKIDPWRSADVSSLGGFMRTYLLYSMLCPPWLSASGAGLKSRPSLENSCSEPKGLQDETFPELTLTQLTNHICHGLL